MAVESRHVESPADAGRTAESGGTVTEDRLAESGGTVTEDRLAKSGGTVTADRSAESSDWTVTQDRPAEAGASGLSPLRWLIAVGRRSWRGLTSMRTALMLLFLLAIAAIPGSLLPQRNLNIEKVESYYQQHPTLAPLLDKLSAFNVFASPWFSAIYLLLSISLIGCLVPRLRGYITVVRRTPPDAPLRLERMPVNASGLRFAESSQVVAERLRMLLRSRRYRAVVRAQPGGGYTVAAEKGYLKETGNLLFHFSLMALLAGVAFGSWYGWHADRLLVAGDDSSFCNTLTQYDEYGLGARINGSDLEPFCVTLDSFHASYLADGQPTAYSADVRYTVGASSTAERPDTIRVNAPLRLPRANVYLLGHGYAPIIRYTDRFGVSQTRVAPFLPADGLLTSSGVAEFPDANIDPKTGSNVDPITFVKDQVGFEGVYVPTVSSTDHSLATSIYPAERDPMLILTPYVGDLGLDSGVPSSVYTLNRSEIAAGVLKKVADPVRLRPGQSAKLPDGSSVEFLGTRPWVSLSVRYDPGEKVVLVGAILLVIGLLLSLTGRRRRVWFRVAPASDPDGRTVSVASAGGLARAEYASFPVEFDAIVKSAGAEGKA